MNFTIAFITSILAQGVVAAGVSIGANIPPPNGNETGILSPTTSHLPGPPTLRDSQDEALKFEAVKIDMLNNDATKFDAMKFDAMKEYNPNITIAKSSSLYPNDSGHHQHDRYPGLWFTKYIWNKDPQNLCSFAEDNHNFTATSAANPDHCEFLYRFFNGTIGAWQVSEWEGGYNHDQDWVVGYIDCKFWVRRKDGKKDDVLFGNIDMRDRLRYALDNYIVDYGTATGKRVGAIGRGNCHEPAEADIEWMIYS